MTLKTNCSCQYIFQGHTKLQSINVSIFTTLFGYPDRKLETDDIENVTKAFSINYNDPKIKHNKKIAFLFQDKIPQLVSQAQDASSSGGCKEVGLHLHSLTLL